jgi:hypothetical protein
LFLYFSISMLTFSCMKSGACLLSVVGIRSWISMLPSYCYQMLIWTM